MNGIPINFFSLPLIMDISFNEVVNKTLLEMNQVNLPQITTVLILILLFETLSIHANLGESISGCAIVGIAITPRN